MEDVPHVSPALEGEENLIAAVKNIVKALGSNNNLTVDARKIMADLGSQLSSMATLDERKEEGSTGFETEFRSIEEKIMCWEEDQSMIWESGPEEAYAYLNATTEVRLLIDRLERLNLNKDDEEYQLLQKAYIVLQTAMARLEKEFRHLLIINMQPFEPEFVSFRWSEEDVVDGNSTVSLADDSFEDLLRRDSTVSKASEENVMDLVHQDAIPDLQFIANWMFASNYDQECSRAYILIRKDALNECLYALDMESLSIEDVLKMKWGTLNSKIKRWKWTMKIFVRDYLVREKRLSDQIFGEGQPAASLACFIDSSKASILQLLNFSEAMSIGPHQPEKLFSILDMYEVLIELLPDINALYPDNAGAFIRSECHEALRRLGDSAKATFLEFGNAVASNTSSTPFAGGAIHPLTKYVMNYLRNLTDYGETLNLLLKDQNEDSDISSSPDMIIKDGKDKEEDDDESPLCRFFAMAQHFQSIASILECKLDDKSKLYKDASLQHLFLMNNIHYISEKAKKSELRYIYGGEWIRKHNWRFQEHALRYKRSSWSSVLSLLMDGGIHSPGTHSVSKSLLTERLRSFYIAFEEMYRSQTAWFVPDPELREDLQISTSQNVIQAYRTFVGRHSNHICEKHIKYSPDDLQNHLLDFFEGSSRSLSNPHWR